MNSPRRHIVSRCINGFIEPRVITEFSIRTILLSSDGIAVVGVCRRDRTLDIIIVYINMRRGGEGKTLSRLRKLVRIKCVIKKKKKPSLMNLYREVRIKCVSVHTVSRLENISFINFIYVRALARVFV